MFWSLEELIHTYFARTWPIATSDITAKIKNTERENFGRSRRLMEACLIWLLYQKLKEQI